MNGQVLGCPCWGQNLNGVLVNVGCHICWGESQVSDEILFFGWAACQVQLLRCFWGCIAFTAEGRLLHSCSLSMWDARSERIIVVLNFCSRVVTRDCKFMFQFGCVKREIWGCDYVRMKFRCKRGSNWMEHKARDMSARFCLFRCMVFFYITTRQSLGFSWL